MQRALYAGSVNDDASWKPRFRGAPLQLSPLCPSPAGVPYLALAIDSRFARGLFTAARLCASTFRPGSRLPGNQAGLRRARQSGSAESNHPKGRWEVARCVKRRYHGGRPRPRTGLC